ncbi:biofilm/acid-resistance regulator YmgB/AriR [Pantoea sp. At-9b]|uniref:biofilm/acid-resistance regulator YmgB/AriR n=1 Tax=Pantoea sp. (strain At-9b) TaxID=592316 RepID=UPI0001B404EA|nr:biofilm/acid-resistance regulator YmgB/AriR [Pantoea sp. At-9b]ADU68744.1 conserved hypothetical protein [Pantoea sp. At-9b]
MQNAAISHDIEEDFKPASYNAEVFAQVIGEILQTGMPVTNKAIISVLISRLELENDVTQLDIYRQLLEKVVNKTPDDLAF